MLLVEQKNVRNTLFFFFAVKEPRNLAFSIFLTNNVSTDFVVLFFFPPSCSPCSLMLLQWRRWMHSREHFPLSLSESVFLWQINVRVTSMDAELEFAILPSTTGKQLFDQVCHASTVKDIIWHAKARLWLCSFTYLDSEDNRAEGDVVLWASV